MKKFKISIFLIFILLTDLFCQNKLTTYNTSWTTVIPGKVLCEPVLTSYGFVIYSDAKSISAFSENGKTLWEKSISGRDIKIYSLPEDFILVYINSSKSISLLNPSGYEIWKNQLESEINDVFAGRDGRFFVKGKDFISCYGITGIRKWQLKTENLNEIKLQELPDGSLILFFEKITEGKTKGIRVSPFGEILEEITFNGEILSASTCKKGILLTFSDGTPGFFSLSDKNLCENKWVLQNVKASLSDENQIKKAEFIVNQNKDEVIYLLPFKYFVQLYKINLNNGTFTNDFTLNNLKGFELKCIKYLNNDFFISDDSNSFLVSDSGKQIDNSTFQFQNKFKWNYNFLTDSENLVFCGTNWSLNAYKINQNLNNKNQQSKKQTYDSYLKVSVNDYSFAFIDKLDSDFASQERINNLYKGDYGPKEIKWACELEEACISFSSSLNSLNGNSRKENTVFDLDTTGTEKMLLQLSAFSDDKFNKYAAAILSKNSNKTLNQALLNGIIKNGYDPDEQLLSAIEKLTEKINYKDEATISRICDSVYSICLFMGRPAFNSKGKDILSKFLFPSYSSTTRIYARETLKKISKLEL